MNLSLVVIAKDEADRIGRCLDSVPLADERIVVESGSSDDTAAVARAHGAQVVQTDWPGFVAQKNRALDLADGRWVLSLDADEWLSTAALASLSAFLDSPGDADGASLPRCSYWRGRPLRHGRWYPDRKLRLVRRGWGRWVGLDPHDQLEVQGPVRALSGDIWHQPYRTVTDHLRTIDRYTRIHAAALDARGVQARWWDPSFRPPLHFVDAYLRRAGFLDGPEGLAVAGLGAAHVWLKWSRLWRLQH